MTAANALLKARNVGVRRFRNRASRFIKSHKVLIITDHGEPKCVLMPYQDMLEIVDVLDELRDKGAIKTVAEGRRSIKAGARGISASTVFKKNKRKKN